MTMSQGPFGADPLDEMWYLQGEAEALGPYTGHALRQMIEAGSVGASSLVARVGATQWSTVADVPWFAACVPPRPPIKYAGFWIRLWASILDSLIIFFVIVAAGMAVAAVAILLGGTGPDYSDVMVSIFPILFLLVAFVFTLFYYIYFPSTRWQATPGKRIAGIYIIREDGRPVTGLLALGRWLAYTLSSIPLSIGFLMIAFTTEKYGLHDLVCGTRVVWGRP
jgi:uncharacterized RDD family membrane protein YckC